jgi:hypothetical protein
MLKDDFGRWLLVYICNILESNPAVQTGPTGLRQTYA